MTSAIFSLEMSRTEITMRLLSAEAQIRLTDMRAGRMGDEDWTRMARRMSEISEAPLFIDDSPNLTMMEIRAKARRLSQRNNLKLLVLDYLQLMSSGKRVESRQQEVSEFSRRSSCWPRSSKCRWWQSVSSTVALSSGRTKGRSCPTYVSPALSSRTPTW
jgi:replicative DNA helicase